MSALSPTLSTTNDDADMRSLQELFLSRETIIRFCCFLHCLNLISTPTVYIYISIALSLALDMYVCMYMKHAMSTSSLNLLFVYSN